MTKKQPTYEEAVSRLEAIVESFERGETDIEQLGARLREANGLLAYCKEKLQLAETEIDEAMNGANAGAEATN